MTSGGKKVRGISVCEAHKRFSLGVLPTPDLAKQARCSFAGELGWPLPRE